jgi:hypothetical protein
MKKNAPPPLDPDVDPGLIAYLKATAPPGVKLLLAAKDPIFVRGLRDIFKLPLPEDLVLMAGDGCRTFVVMPPTRSGDAGLLLTFLNEGDGNVALVPTLVTTDPKDRATWRDTPFSTQAVIDAWESLLFRRVLPAGVVQ